MTDTTERSVTDPKRPPDRVVILQLKRLGDLILATPAIHALRTAWPAAHFTLVTESPFHEVLAGLNDLDAIELHPGTGLGSLRFGERLGRLGADIALDFQGSATSARLALQSRAPRRIGWGRRVRRLAYTDVIATDPRIPRFTADQKLDFLRPLGIEPPPAVPRLVVTPEADAAGAALLDQAGLNPSEAFVLLAPASRRVYKRWAPAAWAGLQEGLADAGRLPVILAGGPGEADQVAAVRIAGRTCPDPVLAVPNLGAWLGVLARASLVVAPDGGVRHMAQALARPTFGLFGPQNPDHWVCPRPPGRHRALAARRADCTRRCSRSETPCPCLSEVTPARVLRAILAEPGAFLAAGLG